MALWSDAFQYLKEHGLKEITFAYTKQQPTPAAGDNDNPVDVVDSEAVLRKRTLRKRAPPSPKPARAAPKPKHQRQTRTRTPKLTAISAPPQASSPSLPPPPPPPPAVVKDVPLTPAPTSAGAVMLPAAAQIAEVRNPL